jgi:hypothetical protein
VSLRRALGYVVTSEEKLLKDFVRFVETQMVTGPIRAQIALDWACMPSPGRGLAGQTSRLKVVRGFLSHLQAALPETEVPGSGMLAKVRRPKPYLYSRQQIETLHDAPAARVAATKSYAGNVVIYDRYKEDRELIGRDLAEKHGLTLIPPYDHPDVIAGQGTAAKELFEEVGALDAFFVPLGGGGLLAGSALSTRALSPDCKLYGVEPEAGNDGQQSFRSGAIVHIDTPKTIADGAQTQHLGTYTFAVIRRDVDDVLTATDKQLVECMRFAASRMKLVIEPTGCLGFAAARQMKPLLKGKRVGVLISGGNVDIERFCSLLAAL